METLRLKTKLIGLKKVTEVPATYHNHELANQMYIDMLKISISKSKDISKLKGETLTKELIVRAENEQKNDQKSISFIKNLLKLSDKDITKVKDASSSQDIVSWVNYAVMRFRGLSDEDLEDIENSQEEVEDPKEEPEDLDNN